MAEMQLAAIDRNVPDCGEIDGTGVTVVVPCFNERAGLPNLFEQLVELDEELGERGDLSVVFVDDGSTDGTWAALQEAAARREQWSTVRHEKNRGIAAAIMSGLRAAATEIVCSIDADCTYDPAVLTEMVPLLTPEVDLVTASPYHPMGRVDGVSRSRLLLSRICSIMYRRALGSKISTFTSCCRVYRRSAIAPMHIERRGFPGVAELLVRLVLSSSKIVEHPATLSVRAVGVSKLRVVPATLAHLNLIWKAGCSRRGWRTELNQDSNEHTKELASPFGGDATASVNPTRAR